MCFFTLLFWKTEGINWGFLVVYCSYATGHRKLLFLMKTGLEQLGEKILLVQVKRKAFFISDDGEVAVLLHQANFYVWKEGCRHGLFCVTLKGSSLQQYCVQNRCATFLKHTQNPVSVTTENTVLVCVRYLTLFLPFCRFVVAYSFFPRRVLYFQVSCTYSSREDVQV